MRRGVLMTMLQQAALQLPMWMGKASERYGRGVFFLQFHFFTLALYFFERR